MNRDAFQTALDRARTADALFPETLPRTGLCMVPLDLRGKIITSVPAPTQEEGLNNVRAALDRTGRREFYREWLAGGCAYRFGYVGQLDAPTLEAGADAFAADQRAGQVRAYRALAEGERKDMRQHLLTAAKRLAEAAAEIEQAGKDILTADPFRTAEYVQGKVIWLLANMGLENMTGTVGRIVKYDSEVDRLEDEARLLGRPLTEEAKA